MIGIRDPQNFASYQFALLAIFLQRPIRCPGGYLKGRRYFPLVLDTGPKILEDAMFQTLKEMKKLTPPLTHAPRTKWMLDMSLRLIEAITDHCRRSDQNLNVEQTLTKAVINSLKMDTRLREEVPAEEIGLFLETSKGKPADLQGG